MGSHLAVIERKSQTPQLPTSQQPTKAPLHTYRDTRLHNAHTTSLLSVSCLRLSKPIARSRNKHFSPCLASVPSAPIEPCSHKQNRTCPRILLAFLSIPSPRPSHKFQKSTKQKEWNLQLKDESLYSTGHSYRPTRQRKLSQHQNRSYNSR
jgi:hypothetical protein